MIFIQTYKRPEVLKKMLDRYPHLKKEATIVLRNDDNFTLTGIKELIGLKGLTCPAQTIAEKKHWIVNYCLVHNINKAILLDDDLIFGVRREDDKTKIRPATDTDVRIMTKMMYDICSPEYPMIHPLMRFMFNNNKYAYAKNRPAIRAVCIHTPTLLKEEIRYDGLTTPFMSDRYMQLSLLEKGYTTIGLGKYCVDDSGTNTPGGCAEYRTPLLQSDAATFLFKRFKPNITLKYKNNGNWSERRLDCTIYWNKYTKGLKYVPKQAMEEFINAKSGC